LIPAVTKDPLLGIEAKPIKCFLSRDVRIPLGMKILFLDNFNLDNLAFVLDEGEKISSKEEKEALQHSPKAAFFLYIKVILYVRFLLFVKRNSTDTSE
jgi:hypothetical protein